MFAKYNPVHVFGYRTPLLAFSELESWSQGLAEKSFATRFDETRRRLRLAMDRPEVREALFLASPDFFTAVQGYLENPKVNGWRRIEHSLVQYYSRLCSRSTPFGLFSGTSTGTLSEMTCLEVPDSGFLQRRTRIDNDYLHMLCERLRAEPSFYTRLMFWPNDTCHVGGGQYRFFEARRVNEVRTYHQVGVTETGMIDVALERARQGASFSDLVRSILDEDPEILEAEAAEFISQLIDCQLLVSTLEPAVTGKDPLQHILEILAQNSAASQIETTLRRIGTRLAEIDREGIGHSPQVYLDLTAPLASLQEKIEVSRLFQVDLFRRAENATLARVVAEDALRAAELLWNLSRKEDPLQSFRDRFRRRYGDSEIPFLEVLDEESGIGLNESVAIGAEASPLLAGLAFPENAADSNVLWSERDETLLRLLHQTWSQGKQELRLTPENLEALKSKNRQPMPNAFAVLCRLASASPEHLQRRDYQLMVQFYEGPTGARLWGRFCSAFRPIEELTRLHLDEEEAADPQRIYAEIVHLGEGRTGNIVSRPLLRNHEIPVMGVSGAPREQQIRLQDLRIRLIGNRIVLRSNRLGREVVPRLTAAHNFHRSHIPAYRFLCLIEQQEGGAAFWSWGALENAPFVPRVVFGRLVLSRARWRLVAADLVELRAAVTAVRKDTKDADRDGLEKQLWDAAQGLRGRLSLPRWVVMVEGDQELLVDFENPLSVEMFAYEAYKMDPVVFKEHFPVPGQLVARGPQGGYCHEMVLSFNQDRGRKP